MKKDAKPIKYCEGLFEPFKNNPNLDTWIDDNFENIMWGLGYEMDVLESYNEYMENSSLKVKAPKSDREKKRNDLYYLEHAPLQIVGNFLFSYWRYLTHWTMYGFTEYDVDFLLRVIDILENKYDEKSSVEEFIKAHKLPMVLFLGEDYDFKYYIEDTSAWEDEDCGIPTVIEENKTTHEFNVCDADKASEIIGLYS